MVNSDSYYEIGAGHVFCQDYADHGTFNILGKDYTYAIVSDGCSGSKDSDIGARLLAKSFPMCIRHLLMHKNDLSLANLEIEFSETWGLKQVYAGPLGMDATIVAMVYSHADDTLYSFAWGDGKIYYAFKSQNPQGDYLNDITFKSNAPFYLSYLQDKSRITEYEKAFGLDYANHQGYIITPTNCVALPESFKSGQKSFSEVYKNASQTLRFASVFSDGIDTYQKKDNPNMSMGRHVLFGEIAGYKNFNGEFVKRRMIAFKKQCAKDGWIHYDDVSAATISFV